MSNASTNLVLRNDTILGVCEAVGQDFGFNPNWLRIAFCAPIYWNPALVLGVYLGLGVLVALTRFAAPDRTVAVVEGDRPAIVEARPTVVEDRELVAAAEFTSHPRGGVPDFLTAAPPFLVILGR